MEVIRPSQYFEGHSMHCPLLKAFNRFQFSSSRKNFARFVLFVFLVYFLLNINGISDWVKGLTQGQHQDTDQQQPTDGGGVGGRCTTGNNGGGHSNENSDGRGGGGSHDPPQTPSSGGGGSSSSGDNGGDDPNKRPPVHKTDEPTEVESKEEESNDDNSESQSKRKGQMVTNQLQPGIRPPQAIDISRRHGDSLMLQQQSSNTWMSSPYKGFEHSDQLRTCPAEEKATIHELTNDEQQPQQPLQSAASVGEEQLNLDLISMASTDNEGVLEQLPFYAAVPIESFSGPHSASHLGLDVSAESIHALHANTYYELAHLQSVQEQVLQAAETTEPFDYTLAFVMYDNDGTQLLIPCLPTAEFDPAENVHVVAIPADSILSHFTVHINPRLQCL